MEADRGDPGLLDQPQRQLEAGAIAGLDPRAQLHGHRQAAALGGPAGQRQGQLGVAQQLDAGAGTAHLAHRAAHVDVDQVGAGLGGDRGAGAHHLGVVAEELHRDRVLVGVDPHQLAQGALVAVVQAEAGDHLRDRQPGPVAFRLQAHEPVADPGQRRQQDPVGDPHSADLEGVGQLRRRVALMDQAQALQGEHLVDLVDRLGEGDDRRAARPPVARSAASPSSSSIRRTMPSISPAKPKTKPDWIAARLERPIAVSGSARSMRGIRAARSTRALSEISRPGAIAPPRYSPVGGDRVEVDAGAEVDDDAGTTDPVVGGDRVDEAVGADLERVVDPDRHPGLHPGPDRQALGLQVALGQLLVLGPERRHHRGDADRVEVAEAHPAEREEAGDPLGQLVAGRPRAGLEAPVLGEALAVEGAEVGLGVADVDREEHEGDYARRMPLQWTHGST